MKKFSMILFTILVLFQTNPSKADFATGLATGIILSSGENSDDFYYFPKASEINNYINEKRELRKFPNYNYILDEIKGKLKEAIKNEQYYIIVQTGFFNNEKNDWINRRNKDEEINNLFLFLEKKGYLITPISEKHKNGFILYLNKEIPKY